jgi:PIN domain nuclease of toxin-antitoxin system
MTLLLDTCAFIWLCSAPENLSNPATKTLDEKANDRALSLASIWEITLKFHSGKLPLPELPYRWIEQQLNLQDIDVLPLQRTTLYRAGSLPPIHKDPFDRVIAADALQRNLRVVSPDAPFRLYGCQVVW